MNKSKKPLTAAGIVNDLLELAEAVYFSIFLVLMIFTYVFRVSDITGRSMEPTLYEGDRVLVQPMFYSLNQNDIVIIESSKLDKLIVKRVIAVEGQTVDIDFESGLVYVDGVLLNEQVYDSDDRKGKPELTADYFIKSLTTRDMGAFDSYPVTVPPGHIFVLGDNRIVSKDSKHADLGFVPESEVAGKVIMRIYPRSEFGQID